MLKVTVSFTLQCSSSSSSSSSSSNYQLLLQTAILLHVVLVVSYKDTSHIVSPHFHSGRVTSFCTEERACAV